MKADQNRWGAGWSEGGYKNPPKHSQFQAGKSGNPKGRPRKLRGTRQILQDALNEATRVTENGKTKLISKKELLIKVILASAIKGNSKSTSTLFKMMYDYKIADDLDPGMNEMIVKFVGMPEKKI